jgi:hypothetical protein
MNTLIGCSFAVTVLASAAAAFAQAAGQQPQRAQDDGAADQSTNALKRPSDGQFFFEAPPGHLSPPPERDALLESMRQRYPDLAEALDIDATTAQQLLELLTEQRLKMLEATHLNVPRPSSDWLLREADDETKRLDALRGLLGTQGLDRFQYYSTTIRERGQVTTFDARLSGEHKLLPAQREQLIALYREENERLQRGLRGRFHTRRQPMPPQGPIEDRHRASQLAAIAATEAQLRTMQQSRRRLALRASEFLSEAQLAALSLMHTEEENRLAQGIEKARLAAGLAPTISVLPPLAADESPEPAKPPAVQVKMDITLAIDGNEPRRFSKVVTNGETAAFQADGGLLVEATPTIHGENSIDVELTYYEDRGTGKRRLTDVATVSSLGLPGAPMDIERLTVSAGSKAYAIKAHVSPAVL